jgi:hypothetical protein
MRQILFLAALLLLCNVSQAFAADAPLATSASIQTCSSCGNTADSKCGCEQKKSCGCEKQAKCGCEQKKSCGCEKEKECGCVSNEIAYGDGLAFSMVGADSMARSGLAFTMTDMRSEPLDPNCCPSEIFCLLDNCTACYTLACCPDSMRLLCKSGKCEKQKCSSCNKCSDSKCGSKSKCGCAKSKCASKCGCN